LNSAFHQSSQAEEPSAACFSPWLFRWTPSSNVLSTMANKSSSNFSHMERTISLETEPQALDQLGDNVSPPTPRMHRKPNDSFKSEDNLKEGISLLTNTYAQFANNTIQDCIKDGFPLSFLLLSESTSSRIVHQCRCLYVRAREELHAGHRWLGSHFFFFIIWRRVRNCTNWSHM